MRTPSTKEEEKPPPKLKVQMWKSEPKTNEFFTGREHLLVGSWPIENKKQLAQYHKQFRQYKQSRYEVNAVQWDGKAYLYVRPTKMSGRTGEFVRETYPVKQRFGVYRWFTVPKSKIKGTFERVGFYNNLADLESAQNNLRKKQFVTKYFPYRKQRVRGKTEIGYVLYARHVKEPERKPVVGGGATGKMSSRQVREVLKHYKDKGITVGEKLDWYKDGKKVSLYPHKKLTHSYSKMTKEYNKLKKQGHIVVPKGYMSETGAMYYILFVSEKKWDSLATIYKERKKQKKIKLTTATPEWTKPPSTFAEPSKPHPNAVLVLEEGATDFEGQQAIIRKQKFLKKKGIETEVVFGTLTTHLYALPSKGQKSVVLPKRHYKPSSKRPPKLERVYATEEVWKSRDVDIKPIERERLVKRIRKAPQRTSIVAVRRRSNKKY